MVVKIERNKSHEKPDNGVFSSSFFSLLSLFFPAQHWPNIRNRSDLKFGLGDAGDVKSLFTHKKVSFSVCSTIVWKIVIKHILKGFELNWGLARNVPLQEKKKNHIFEVDRWALVKSIGGQKIITHNISIMMFSEVSFVSVWDVVQLAIM